MRVSGSHKILTFGEHKSDFVLKQFKPEKIGSYVDAVINGKECQFRLNLPAKVNALNALCALAMFEGLGYKSIDCANRLVNLPEIMGRWNWVDCGQPFNVVVDKANTPEALKIIGEHMDSVKASRKIAVICTVGEGGAEGRLEMAKVTAKAFDLIIVSYDDAKDEDPDAIVDEFSNYLFQLGANLKKYRTGLRLLPGQSPRRRRTILSPSLVEAMKTACIFEGNGCLSTTGTKLERH